MFYCENNATKQLLHKKEIFIESHNTLRPLLESKDYSHARVYYKYRLNTS